MRLIQLILFTLFFQCISAQTIFEDEQKISQSEDLIFKEISFTNAEDDVKLSGTLIYPKVGFEKVVMIVPGSGKNTRHAHFLIAENFLKHNIAVYRFDDRGTGKSDGKFDDTASCLINDVVYAYHELRKKKELTDKKIGILGHSLGGIASIGAHGKGCDFDFLIQMSTPVENNAAFMKHQAVEITDGGFSVKNKSTKEVIGFLDALMNIVLVEDDFKTTQKKAKALMKQMGFKKARHIVNPVVIDLMKQEHEKTYQVSTVPILFINGTDDKRVGSTNERLVIEKLGNPNIETTTIENVDHWLTDKSASSYAMNEEAINKIISWTLEK